MTKLHTKDKVMKMYIQKVKGQLMFCSNTLLAITQDQKENVFCKAKDTFTQCVQLLLAGFSTFHVF